MVSLDVVSMPARVEVRSYDAVDETTGVPIEDGSAAVCATAVSSGDECAVERAPSGVEVTLPTATVGHVVLYVEWYVPVETRPSGSDATVRTVSYGFRVEA